MKQDDSSPQPGCPGKPHNEEEKESLSRVGELEKTLRDCLSDLDNTRRIIQEYRDRQEEKFEERCRRAEALGKPPPDRDQHQASLAFDMLRLRKGIEAYFVYTRHLLPTVVTAFDKGRDLRPNLTQLTDRQRGELERLTGRLYRHVSPHKERMEAVAGQIYLAQVKAHEELQTYYPDVYRLLDEIRLECRGLAPLLVRDKLRRSDSKNTKKYYDFLVKRYEEDLGLVPPLSLADPVGNVEAAYRIMLATQWPRTSQSSIRNVREKRWARALSKNLPLFDEATQIPIGYSNKYVLPANTLSVLAGKSPLTTAQLRAYLAGIFSEVSGPHGRTAILQYSDSRVGTFPHSSCTGAVFTDHDEAKEFLSMFGLAQDSKYRNRKTDSPQVKASTVLDALTAGVLQSGFWGHAIRPKRRGQYRRIRKGVSVK